MLKCLAGVLAGNGEHDAVDFLVNECFADADGAIEKYILKGEFKRVVELTRTVHAFRYAVYISAREGVIEELTSVTDVLDLFMIVGPSIEGYACGGRYRELNELCSRYPGYIDPVFSGLLAGKHLENRASTLKALSHIDDAELRKSIVELSGMESKNLLHAASRMNALMCNTKMTYEEALQTETDFWLEMAPNIQTKKRTFSPGLFSKVDSSDNQVEQTECISYSPVI
jgi:hypothetical protein